MSTNSNVSSGRIKALPLYGILLVVGLILALLIINPPSINLSAPAVPVAEPSPARGRAADTARWNGMAGAYAASPAGMAASLVRSRAADAARLNLMADQYAKFTEAAANLERGRAADEARWTGMAGNYLASQAANLARGRAADTARLNGRVGAYAASPAGMADNLARSRAADSVRWNAMAKSLYASLGT